MKFTRRDIAVAAAAAIVSGVVATAAMAASQPHMNKALDYLRAAKLELNQAAANKGGHRVKAISLVDQAIEQVRLGRVVGQP